jgi:ADP-ribose pyrophosphatase YjhB (NUDIX family)
MDDIGHTDIDSVAVEPDYCHRCGTNLGTTDFQGYECGWCPSCEMVLSRAVVAGVHVIVHDDERVLLLDEPIPQHDGLWSLPGGFAKPHDGPKEAGLREFEEETGLRADPADLRFVTILHAEFPESALYLITYAVEREHVTGELTPEFEDGGASFRSLEEIRSKPDRIRESDVDRIEKAMEHPGTG